jgi:hypothetical protein
MPEKSSKVSKTPDIELTADVKTERLRFERAPKTRTTFMGTGERKSISKTERENLPESVERDVVYRESRVRWRAASEAVREEWLKD